jgi:hypothetical protein
MASSFILPERDSRAMCLSALVEHFFFTTISGFIAY